MLSFKDYIAEKSEDPCWDDYEMIGMKKKNGKTVPNCVPKEDAVCRVCGQTPCNCTFIESN